MLPHDLALQFVLISAGTGYSEGVSQPLFLLAVYIQKMHYKAGPRSETTAKIDEGHVITMSSRFHVLPNCSITTFRKQVAL